MTEELVAKVARAIDDTYDTYRGEMTNLEQVARAVIPVVRAYALEEAAKVADAEAEDYWAGDGAEASESIATAIRSLAKG
jgi:hypothetical protein